TTDAFTNLVTLGAKSKLMSLMQVSLSCFLIMSSLLHQATTGASLLHQATTGASLLHQASTGASLMQRIQRKSVERLVPSSSAFSSLNMAEKVPSFKTGGTLWFTDLTTAYTTYILPLLTAITFIIMVESNLQEGMEGNPVAGTMKKFSRIIAFLSIPILMGIEKALFCYWLTSNLFTLGYGLGKSPPLSLSHRVLRPLRRPDVRKLLNLPDAVTSSSTGQPKPPSPIPFSFEQPKDQSVIGHEDPPMVNKEASGPQASCVEN
ncbi:hypothetical protein HID58_052051, partial [Brassica napus]